MVKNMPSSRRRSRTKKSTPKKALSQAVKPTLDLELERLQTHPNLFESDKKAPMASAIPIFELSKILTQKHNLSWGNDANGKLCYFTNSDSGSIHFWVTDDIVGESPETLAGAAALAFLEKLDIRAACLHLIFAAHAAQLKRSWEEDLVIDDRQIESYLGLDRRTDLSRSHKIALIKNLVEQPCKITTFINWPKQAKRRGFTVEEGRLWHLMGTRYHYQPDLLGNKTVTGMTFIVRAGLWAKYFLNEENDRAHTAFYQRSMLPKLLLESIMSLWQHREGAARLMVWLLFKSQGVLPSEPFYVKTLLEIAYGAAPIEQAKSDRLKRKKLANDWDEILLCLHERGWRLNFDESYPSEIQPPGFGRTTDRRPKGFFKQLLTARLWIEPEETLVAEPISFQNEPSLQVNGLTANAHDELTPQLIKELRLQKGWSQRDLATESNLSQALISNLEKGTRTITEESRLQLKAAFGLD